MLAARQDYKIFVIAEKTESGSVWSLRCADAESATRLNWSVVKRQSRRRIRYLKPFGESCMEDLLAEGKLWSNWKERVDSDMGKRRSLDALFDFCKRMTQAPSPIGPRKKTIGAVLDELMLGHNSRRGESLDKEKSKTGEVPSVDVRDRAQLGDFFKFMNREKSINTC